MYMQMKEKNCKLHFIYYSSLHLLQDGGTALYMASQYGHTSVVDVLLRHGTDPNLPLTVSIEVVH